MAYKGKIKPKKVHNEKSSDRRLASGYRPNSFLKSNQELTIKDHKALERTVPVLNDILKARKDESKKSGKVVERVDPKTGRKWYDASLVDWNPSHFRLFVGNLGPDVTEELLFRIFIKYPSLSKVKIPSEMKNDKVENKGYGFISFADADDYLHCFKEMNGKYAGSKPIVLQKARTEIGKTVSKGKYLQIHHQNNRKPKKDRKRKPLV
ncbi:hypothetical protein FOA43_001698 [Brettanomyces nanus]|uniref:RRM domain-containing protein n=1 Tax=Eeniella nana TaxID=13502 RepID=A0A875RXZ8_EENNA|nr:uncharacterized protein FOA43_001698 [Brettanomyces nanus]QPG74371.1 hypothetical protein FOA43_001698 [Brettanomyces nanus]